MAPNFQSSFIPKGPVTQETFKKKKTGIAGVLAISLFIISIVAAGGAYAYKAIIKGNIQDLQAELANAEKNIDKENIVEMAQFGKKLDLVKSIVSKHQVVSNFLNELSSSTVSSVYFVDFSYGSVKDGSLDIVLHGKSTSYAGVALQEDILLKNKNFRSVSFTNLTLADKGLISFDLNISIDPQISVYSPPVDNIEEENPNIDSLGIDNPETKIDNIDAEINNILKNE